LTTENGPARHDVYRFVHAKPFYPRLLFKGFVTLIHVTNEAFESFQGTHEEFLWQEMKRNANAEFQGPASKCAGYERYRRAWIRQPISNSSPSNNAPA
jgi:hypothetical protein